VTHFTAEEAKLLQDAVRHVFPELRVAHNNVPWLDLEYKDPINYLNQLMDQMCNEVVLRYPTILKKVVVEGGVMVKTVEPVETVKDEHARIATLCCWYLGEMVNFMALANRRFAVCKSLVHILSGRQAGMLSRAVWMGEVEKLRQVLKDILTLEDEFIAAIGASNA